MTWSEIFTEFEVRHRFLHDKLEMERDKFVIDGTTADEIVTASSKSSAIQPSAIVIPK